MSHADPTFCISVPMFDTNWATNNAKKIRYRNGAHGDVRRRGEASAESLTRHQPGHRPTKTASMPSTHHQPSATTPRTAVEPTSRGPPTAVAGKATPIAP